MAYDFLLRTPKCLNKIRSQLQHMILDEYQDVSVAPHKLLKLLIRGPVESPSDTIGKIKLPVLSDHKREKLRISEPICLNVPKIFCAGDANQSIYGWRGAAPLLTIDGFKKDFPQGLVIPLQMNYRLPCQILSAADVLLEKGDNVFISSNSVQSDSLDISPAAKKSTSTLVREYMTNMQKYCPDNFDQQLDYEDLLLHDTILNELRCAVSVKGLWDIREEAKHITSKILRRSKERLLSLSKTFQKHSRGLSKRSKKFVFDSTEVAIKLRSSKDMPVFEEILSSFDVPYTKGDETSTNKMRSERLGLLRSMKPVNLITMHGGKGDEFDDVYLAGWTEGVFPHKSAVHSNRLNEERRIAYVAFTRARQNVLVTYSFVNRTPYFGPLGDRKEVTEQAEPSRFLHDLISKWKDSNGRMKSQEVEWCNKVGFKEIIAGKHLPNQFRKAYRVPPGYKTRDLFTGQPQKQVPEKFNNTSQMKRLETVKNGLLEIYAGERGSCKKYKILFREILREMGLSRGSGIVLKDKAKTKAMDALVNAHPDGIETRALSRCTAKELGLYIIYLSSRKE